MEYTIQEKTQTSTKKTTGLKKFEVFSWRENHNIKKL